MLSTTFPGCIFVLDFGDDAIKQLGYSHPALEGNQAEQCGCGLFCDGSARPWAAGTMAEKINITGLVKRCIKVVFRPA